MCKICNSQLEAHLHKFFPLRAISLQKLGKIPAKISSPKKFVTQFSLWAEASQVFPQQDKYSREVITLVGMCLWCFGSRSSWKPAFLSRVADDNFLGKHGTLRFSKLRGNPAFLIAALVSTVNEIHKTLARRRNWDCGCGELEMFGLNCGKLKGFQVCSLVWEIIANSKIMETNTYSVGRFPTKRLEMDLKNWD